MDIDQYCEMLASEDAMLSARERGQLWADRVANAPRSNEGWAERDVVPRILDDTTRAFVLRAVDHVLDDPAAAAAFTAAARGWSPAQLDQVPPLLREIVATRATNAWLRQRIAHEFSARSGRNLDPAASAATVSQESQAPARRNAVSFDAAAKIVAWALDGLPPEAQAQGLRSLFTGRALGVADTLTSRHSSDVQPVVPAGREQLDDTLRLAAERERREAERRRAEALAWGTAVRADPLGAFDLAWNQLGEASRNVNAIIAGARTQELSAESRIFQAAGHLVEGVRDGRADVLPDRVAQLLGAAALAKQNGHDFGFMTNRLLELFEELPAVTAPSPDEFWERLWALSDQREVDASATVRLYGEWRQRRIAVASRQHRDLVTAELGNHAELEPPPGTDIRVTVSGATIRYADVEQLIADMSEYFVPMPGEVAPSGEVSRANLVGSSGGAALLDHLNRGLDAKNMHGLAADIRRWSATGTPEYVDDEAQHGGTPYKYGPGLFSGHGIHVERVDDGSVRLRFTGGGYGPDGASMARDYGAFTGRPVEYDGVLTLAAQFPPTPSIATAPLTFDPAEAARGDYIGSVAVPIDVGAFARFVQGIVGGDDRSQKDGNRFATEVAHALVHYGTTGGRSRDPVVVRTNGTEVWFGPYGMDLHFDDSVRKYPQVSEPIVSLARMFRSERDDAAMMLMPRISVSVRMDDGDSFTRIADLLTVGTSGALSAGASDDLGYAGDGVFHFGQRASESLLERARAARQQAADHAPERAGREARDDRRGKRTPRERRAPRQGREADDASRGSR